MSDKWTKLERAIETKVEKLWGEHNSLCSSVSFKVFTTIYKDEHKDSPELMELAIEQNKNLVINGIVDMVLEHLAGRSLEAGGVKFAPRHGMDEVLVVGNSEKVCEMFRKEVRKNEENCYKR